MYILVCEVIMGSNGDVMDPRLHWSSSRTSGSTLELIMKCSGKVIFASFCRLSRAVRIRPRTSATPAMMSNCYSLELVHVKFGLFRLRRGMKRGIPLLMDIPSVRIWSEYLPLDEEKA